MKRELISVIVPVYNVEKYLSDCIQSILEQSYDSFEVLLVDDGSTDKSGMICESFQKQDSRIRVFHKMNGGLSDARNYGLKHAIGKYVTFVDSDDYLSSYCLEYMYNAMQNYHLDIVQGLFTRDETRLGKGQMNEITVFNSPEETLNNYLNYHLLEGHACNKLYISELFDDIRYPVGKIQEDAWTTYKVFAQSNRVGVVDYYSYYYRYNNMSIMNREFDIRRFEIINLPDHILEFLDKNGLRESLEKDLDYFAVRLALKTYNDCISHNSDKKFDAEMIKTRDYILSKPMDCNKLGIKYSLLIFFLRLAPHLYKTIIREKRKI